MFRIRRGRDDPRHGRQRAVRDVARQIVQCARGQRAVAQRGVAHVARMLPSVLLKARERIVVVVVRHVLVDAPGHAGVLQTLGVCGPGIAFTRRTQPVVGVDQRGAAGRALRVVGAGPQKQPVGIGAGLDRAMIGIAQREGIGQRGLKRHVGAAVGSHAQPGLGGQPLIHAAVVPGALRIVPGVRRDVADRLVAGDLCLQIVGAAMRVAIGLRQHRARARGHGMRIGESAHARQRAEVMVEGPVLLHQDHDMPHILQRAGLAVGFDRQRARNDRGRVRVEGRARFFFHDSFNTVCNLES